MSGLLRRVRERHPVLTVVVVAAVLVGILALLWFVVFPYVDRFLPGEGML